MCLYTRNMPHSFIKVSALWVLDVLKLVDYETNVFFYSHDCGQHSGDSHHPAYGFRAFGVDKYLEGLAVEIVDGDVKGVIDVTGFDLVGLAGDHVLPF